ncbi:MAG TPA: hypothetical protein DCW35_07105 [Polynucleobacter sp.]|nr:hypothetical protein [Polynucleobacter sp.]
MPFDWGGDDIFIVRPIVAGAREISVQDAVGQPFVVYTNKKKLGLIQLIWKHFITVIRAVLPTRFMLADGVLISFGRGPYVLR